MSEHVYTAEELHRALEAAGRYSIGSHYWVTDSGQQDLNVIRAYNHDRRQEHAYVN